MVEKLPQEKKVDKLQVSTLHVHPFVEKMGAYVANLLGAGVLYGGLTYVHDNILITGLGIVTSGVIIAAVDGWKEAIWKREYLEQQAGTLTLYDKLSEECLRVQGVYFKARVRNKGTSSFFGNRGFLAGLSPEELRQAASIFTKAAIDPLSSTEKTRQLAELVAYTTLLSEGEKITSPDLTVEQMKAMGEITGNQIILLSDKSSIPPSI